MTTQLVARLMVDVDSDESKESVNREEDYCVYDTEVSDVDSKYSESEETVIHSTSKIMIVRTSLEPMELDGKKFSLKSAMLDSAKHYSSSLWPCVPLHKPSK